MSYLALGDLGAVSAQTYANYAAVTTIPPAKTSIIGLPEKKTWSVAKWKSEMPDVVAHYKILPWEIAAIPNFQVAIQQLSATAAAQPIVATPNVSAQVVQPIASSLPSPMIGAVAPVTQEAAQAAPIAASVAPAPLISSVTYPTPMMVQPTVSTAAPMQPISTVQSFLSGPNAWLVYAGGAGLLLLLLMRRKT